MQDQYDSKIIDKGRMRCITFWHRKRLRILNKDGVQTFCKDRTLLIPFELISTDTDSIDNPSAEVEQLVIDGTGEGRDKGKGKGKKTVVPPKEVRNRQT